MSFVFRVPGWVLRLNMVDKSISPLQTNFELDLVFEQSSEGCTGYVHHVTHNERASAVG
jgi:hypothetical protein